MNNDFIIKIKKFIPYIISVVVLIIILITVYISLNSAKKEIVTYKISKGQDIYFYINKAKYEYSSKITVSNENEIIKLTTDGYEHDFDSQPIYFKNKQKILFPNNMSLVFTKNNFIQNRINKFSTIELDGSYHIKNKNLDYTVNNAFLYDCNDTYFFLNKTNIKIGEYSYSLSPYSYLIFNYNKELYMYDYENDKMIYFESINDDVFAYNDDYNINVGTDSIIYPNGQKLLMKNFKFINKLK